MPTASSGAGWEGAGARRIIAKIPGGEAPAYFERIHSTTAFRSASLIFSGGFGGIGT